MIITFLLLSCEVGKFDGQESPNYLTPESANSEYLLNELQNLFENFMSNISLGTDDIMRYEAMTDTYGDVADINALNTEWEKYYEALSISRVIENKAATNPNLLFHNAINKLLIGYLTITMVDYVGNIPYKEASDPLLYLNPKLDDGAELYKIVLSDIDKAIIDINQSTINVSNDLFYANDKAKWIAFANSFKLKILIQTRLASSSIGITDLKSEINKLLNEDLIDINTEDFVCSNTAVEEPESRHAYFTRGYVSGFSQYIGNYFMWMLKDSKSTRDPRIRYYLYRQSSRNPFGGKPAYLACQGDISVDYCYVGEQYWGLDQGESRTGRGDNLYRTVYGIYPGGGAFDEDQFIEASKTTNLAGAGIFPVLTTSYLKFLLAEAALKLGIDRDPAVLLEEGIRASMDKVLNFGNVTSTMATTQSEVDGYVAEVLSNFNTAATDEEKLDIIITEYYLATFGNSVEAYNAYRRTGYPSNIQIPIDDDDPTFPRSFYYSNNAVMNNMSISQKKITDKVFWDTNPDYFIK